MNTDLVRQEARLLAIEYMVMHVYNSLLMLHNVSEDDIEKIERHSLDWPSKTRSIMSTPSCPTMRPQS